MQIKMWRQFVCGMCIFTLAMYSLVFINMHFISGVIIKNSALRCQSYLLKSSVACAWDKIQLFEFFFFSAEHFLIKQLAAEG